VGVEDLDLAFIFHVYHDQQLGKRLIYQLRRHYPDRPIICISDGVEDAEFTEFAERYGVKYIQGDRLKTRRLGGQWADRMFRTFLEESPAAHLIKLDPDSFVLRPFDYLPVQDVFGTLNPEVPMLVRGGCVGYRRSAVEKIVNSELLHDPKYHDSRLYSYRRFSQFRHEHEPENRQFVSCVDRILADITKQLDLSVGVWEEVNVLFRGLPSMKQCAVVHPVLLHAAAPCF